MKIKITECVTEIEVDIKELRESGSLSEIFNREPPDDGEEEEHHER